LLQPFGKVPVLEDGDLTIFGKFIIIHQARYICSLFFPNCTPSVKKNLFK